MKLGMIGLSLLVSTVMPAPVLAADEGEPAPPLAIKRWVLGEPVRVVGQASDNIYVVAFWATWAKPSTESLLTLAGIQRKFKESNIRVIAISDEPVERVEAFVKNYPEFSKLNLRIAVDNDSNTTISYMKAAGRRPLPHVFVINKEGILAWQGHPLEAKAVIEKVIDGSYKIRRPGEPPEPEYADPELVKKIEEAEKAENWSTALDLANELLAKFPDTFEVEDALTLKFTILYTHLKDDIAAEDFARDVIKTHADKYRALNNIAWTLMTAGNAENLDRRWPELAHLAARLAYDVTEGGSPAIVDTYARSLYLLGYLVEAVNYQRRAVGIVQQYIDLRSADEENKPDEKELQDLNNELRNLETTLKYYEDIARIRGAFKPSEEGR
ncbi:MAG: redoxin domain-containing protein [Planctomycetes bacterium]|nr:redoxin domain-containing protein [Planctomycetota bacterium]